MVSQIHEFDSLLRLKDPDYLDNLNLDLSNNNFSNNFSNNRIIIILDNLDIYSYTYATSKEHEFPIGTIKSFSTKI